MTTYIRIGRVPSESNPDQFWDVHTDGTQLTCQCPGWTRQTHYAPCPAIRGAKCTCRGVSPLYAAGHAKDTRTCKHVREIQPRVDAAGGIAAAINLINIGVTLGDIPTTRQTPRISAAEQLAERERYERDRAAANERERVAALRRMIRQPDWLCATCGSYHLTHDCPDTSPATPREIEAPGGRAIRIREED